MIFSAYNLSTTVCLKCLVLGINRFNMVAPVGTLCYSLKLGGLWFGLHYSLTRQNRGCPYALVPSQNLLCQGNGPSSHNKTVTSSVWLTAAQTILSVWKYNSSELNVCHLKFVDAVPSVCVELLNLLSLCLSSFIFARIPRILY